MERGHIKRVLSPVKCPGVYQVFLNSKTPITRDMIINELIKNNVNLDKIKVSIETRVLKDDIVENWPMHLVLTVFTGGLNLIGIFSFWFFELRYPLYIVTLRVGMNAIQRSNIEMEMTNPITLPLAQVQIGDENV